VMQLLQDQFEVLKTGDINSLGNNIGSMYDVLASAMKLPQSFGDAQVSDRAVPLYIESVLIAQFNRRLFIHFRTRLWFHCSKFHQALNKLIRLVPFSD